MTASDFDDFIEQYHHALDEMVKGNAEGYERVYSRRDDVTLANPFGPAVRGWEQVAQTIARVVTFRDGEVTGFDPCRHLHHAGTYLHRRGRARRDQGWRRD